MSARLTLSLFALLIAACGGAVTPAAPIPAGKKGVEIAVETTIAEKAPEEHPGLHNLFRLSKNILSGAEPHGEEALAKLAEMGVKTVVSVDGKVPDAETAAKHGLRYVHVPIQYSGIKKAEREALAKTFRELDGPFYVHCFHGKHRGPAAAAWGRVVLDGAPREQALAEMLQWCGTSKKYVGLFETIARAEAPTTEATKGLDFDFPAAHALGGVREIMIDAARTFDYLKALEKRDWQADPEHPDVDARNEAAKLTDLFKATENLQSFTMKPADFKAWTTESRDHAEGLSANLPLALERDEAAIEAAKAAFGEVANRCGACHQVYRNN